MEPEEYDTWCFGLIRTYKLQGDAPSIEQQPAIDIIERLYALMRAKKTQMSTYDTEEREERLASTYQATKQHPNMDLARSHMRLALSARKTHTREQLKYETLRGLASRLEEARRNVSAADSMLASARTLKEIVDGMPDAADVMDAVRLQLDRVQEHSDELTVPLIQHQQEEPVDPAELDALLFLPDAPTSATAVPKSKSLA